MLRGGGDWDAAGRKSGGITEETGSFMAKEFVA